VTILIISGGALTKKEKRKYSMKMDKDSSTEDHSVCYAGHEAGSGRVDRSS
jgi:hypothetical protein